MNPNIGKELIPKIKTAFGITTEPIIKYDRSEHYKYYLDRKSLYIKIIRRMRHFQSILFAIIKIVKNKGSNKNENDS